MSEPHHFCRVWDVGDPMPGRDVVELVESTFFLAEDDQPILFANDMTLGWFTWKTFLFGRWVHMEWDDVVRRFGPVRAVLNKEL